MRGRQQYYLTIGCASNWPGLAPPPRRDMPIFRWQDWMHWDNVQFSNGPRGMSFDRGGAAWGMPIFRGQEWAIWDYVQPRCGRRGMSCGGNRQRGACPLFAVSIAEPE